MATVQSALTSADLHVLIRGDSEDLRAQAAQKLCTVMVKSVLTPNERIQAHEILRFMAADAARAVRCALVTTLTSSP